jgi:hypothetical protein
LIAADLTDLAHRVEHLERENESLRERLATVLEQAAHELDVRRNRGAPVALAAPWNDETGGVPLQLRAVVAGALSNGRLHVVVRAVDEGKTKLAVGYYAEAEVISRATMADVMSFAHREFKAWMPGCVDGARP